MRMNANGLQTLTSIIPSIQAMTAQAMAAL
jgi:hypothetical protein